VCEQQVWIEALALVVLIVVAAGLRFASIGSKSFWVDEAYSAFVASHSPREIVTIVARDDAHPPVYYLALSAWSRMVGTDDAALRSLGAIASVLTVAGAWWLGRRLGGPALGILTASLTAVSPFQVLAAQEARMYALLGLLTVFSWVALLEATAGRRGAWVAYVSVTTLALYTHYFAFLSVIGQGVFVFGAASRSWRSWAACQGVLIVLYLPWSGRLLATITSSRGIPLEVTSLTALLGFLSFGGHAFGFARWFRVASASLPLQIAILAPFVGLAVLGLVAARREPRDFWFLSGSLIAPLVFALAFSLRTNVIYPRYFSFIHVPFALVLALGMLHVASYFHPAYRRRAVWASGLLCVIGSTFVLRGLYLDPNREVFDWRGAAVWFEQAAGPNDFIVITPGYDRLAFSRYFRGQQQIIGLDPIELSDPKKGRPQPAGEVQMRALFQSIAASHAVMWVITDEAIPPAALLRLNTFLEGIFDPREVTNFNGVRVIKARRHTGETHRGLADGARLFYPAWRAANLVRVRESLAVLREASTRSPSYD